eukprot:g49835.t1
MEILTLFRSLVNISVDGFQTYLLVRHGTTEST